MKLKLFLLITVSMLCGVNAMQAMKRTKSCRGNLSELGYLQEQDDISLGLNLLDFALPEKPLITLISGAQLGKKLQAKQRVLQKALKAVARKRKNSRNTLYRQHLDAVRNRVASERLVFKDLNCERT